MVIRWKQHTAYYRELSCQCSIVNQKRIYRVEHIVGTGKSRLSNNDRQDILVLPAMDFKHALLSLSFTADC